MNPIPTLTIQTIILDKSDWNLCITQTHLNSNHEPITDFKWNQTYELDSYWIHLEHPWQKCLRIRFFKSDGLELELYSDNNIFEPYNYIFYLETNLTLKHIVTPGFIHVNKSKNIFVKLAEATDNIKLIAENKIRNSYHCVYNGRIRSNGQIILQSEILHNQKGEIFGKEICFNLKSVTNSNGQICSGDNLLLNGNHLDNYSGLIESKSGSVKIDMIETIETFQGIIRGLSVEIKAGLHINNGSGFIESKVGTLKIQTASSVNNFHGVCQSKTDLTIQTGSKIENWKGIICSLNGKIRLTCGSVLSNIHGGLISSADTAEINCMADIDNFDGVILSGNKLIISTNKKLLNKYGGQINSVNDIHIKAQTYLHNVFALIHSKKNIWITAFGMENRGFDAMINGANIDIKTESEFKLSHESNIKSNRLKLESPEIILKSVIASKHIELNCTRKLTFVGPQNPEYLDINLTNCPFIYEEKQLNATKRFSLTTNKFIRLKIPLRIKGTIHLNAQTIHNQTVIQSENNVVLTATYKNITFPVSNIGTLQSGSDIIIDSTGFRHTYGSVESGRNFKFEGKNIQIISKLSIGGSTHLYAPDQADIEANKCLLGEKSYINYKSCLNVSGLLHLTLPKNQSTFPRDLKTAGGIKLDRDGGCFPFYVYYNLIAEKQIEISMEKIAVVIGPRGCGPVNLHSRKSGLGINAHSLKIVHANIYADGDITFTIGSKTNCLRIGRGIKQTVPMIRLIGRPHFREFVGCPNLKTNFPFKNSNQTLIFTEGNLTINSPAGVKIDLASIICYKRPYWYKAGDARSDFSEPSLIPKGDLIINTNGPVRNLGGRIEVVGNFIIKGKGVFQNRMPTKEHTTQGWNGFNFWTCIAVLPYAKPADLIVGGSLIVERFENFASNVFVRGRIAHPVTSKLIRINTVDYVLEVTTSGFHQNFFSYVEGGQYPVYKLLDPLRRHIISNVTTASGITFTFDPNTLNKIEGANHAPLTKILIPDRCIVQVGANANYPRPQIKKFEPVKKFMDVYKSSALFKPSDEIDNPWITSPIFSINTDIWNLAPAVVVTPQGLMLADDQTKFLLCPLEEVQTMTHVFVDQIGRACLSWTDSDPHRTYIRGRKTAYDFYLRHSNLIQNESIVDIISTLSPREKKLYDFMIVYYETEYLDGSVKQTVLAPASVLSDTYDKPQQRNSDGGMFSDRIGVLGLGSDSHLKIKSTVCGFDETVLKVPRITVERSNYIRTVRVVDTWHRKGGWFSDDKCGCTVRDVIVQTPQFNTGHLQTGSYGKFVIQTENFNLLNGAEVQAGLKNHIRIGTYSSTCAIETNVVRSEAGAKGTHRIEHGISSKIYCPKWTFPSGAVLEIENMNMSGDEFIANKSDLVFKVGRGHLGSTVTSTYVGMTVRSEGKAVVTERLKSQVVAQCKFLALNGNIYWKIRDKVTGSAPILYGRIITFDGSIDIESLFLSLTVETESVIDGLFSTSKTKSTNEVGIGVRAIFEGQEIIFKNGSAKVSGALIKAVIRIVDSTPTGIEIDPTVTKMYYKHETMARSPLSESESGSIGWQEIQLQPIIETPLFIRTKKEGSMSFTNAILNVDKIEGSFEEKVRVLQTWQRSWSSSHQLIPMPVIIAISMIVTYYTGCFFGKFLQDLGMIGSILTSGIQTMTSMATSSILQQGDPVKTIEYLLSPSSLEAIGESMIVSIGANILAPIFNVDMKPGQPNLISNLKKFALNNGLKSAYKIVTGKTPSEAIESGIKQTALEAVGATMAKYIGTNVSNPVLHKVAHGGMASVLSAVTGGTPQQILTAGASAVFAETMAEALIDSDYIMKNSSSVEQFGEKRSELIAIVNAVTVGLVTAFGGHTPTAMFASDNALQNNFTTTEFDSLLLGPTALKEERERELFDLMLEIAGEKKSKWSMLKDKLTNSFAFYSKINYPKVISVITSLVTSGITVAHVAPIIVGSSTLGLVTVGIISMATTLELSQILASNLNLGRAMTDVGTGFFGDKIFCKTMTFCANGLKHIWKEIKLPRLGLVNKSATPTENTFWAGRNLEEYSYMVSNDISTDYKYYLKMFESASDYKKGMVILTHGSANIVRWQSQTLVTSMPKRIFPIQRFQESVVVDVAYRINHRTLAKIIQSHPAYKPTVPILLCSCSTGKYSDGFAQKLANKLGSVVQAPTGMNTGVAYLRPVRITNTNFVLVAKICSKLKRNPFKGSVRTFYPGEWNPRLVRLPESLVPNLVLYGGIAVAATTSAYILAELTK